MKDKFEEIREFFPHTKKIVFFNTAAFGPMSIPIKKAIDDNLELRMAAEIDDTKGMYELRDRVRAGYAKIVGAEKRQIGISLNTSFGLTLAANGLPLNEGDEVLISDVEFPALIYAWRGAAESKNLKLKFIKSKDRKFDVAEFEKSITIKSRVLGISFVQFFNGFKNDLKKLSSLCREHDIFFVVDGIQGTGAEPINVKELEIDVFSCGCQKWLLAPFGSGFFYVSDRVRERITSQNVTWYSSNWNFQFSGLFKYDLPYYDTVQKFEGGYYATMNLLGMEASQKMILDLVVADIQKHNYQLIDRIVASIKNSEFYTITSSLRPQERSSILTITCDNLKELHRFLFSHKIYTACREGSVRIAVHLFNNESDVDKLIDVLQLFEKEQSREPVSKIS